MKNNIKFIIAIFFLIGIIFACGKTDKTVSNRNKLDDEAQSEADKIFNQYYLIENGSWYTCKMDSKIDNSGKIKNAYVPARCIRN